MALPHDDPRPPYLLAADKLRAEIAGGRLKPGDRLPSSRPLRDSLGIAYATVHRALQVLRDEGLIYSVHGRGSYVRDPGVSPSGPVAEFVETLRSMEEEVRSVRERVENLEGRVLRLERAGAE